MNSISHHASLLTILLLSMLFLISCSLGGTSRPAQFYTLDAISSDTISGLEDMSIGIGPIDIPGYINRPQVVTKSGNVELSYAEFHRWAEPIDEMLTRTLTQNIVIRSGSNQVLSHPWSTKTNPDMKLKAKIIKFENNSQGDALLIVQWQLINQAENIEPLAKYSEFRATAISGEYQHRVAALNETISQFSDEILNQIRR